MKVCPRCGKEKSKEEFCRNRQTKSGLASWCRKCSAEKQLSWREKNQGKIKEYANKYKRGRASKFMEYRNKWNEANRFQVALINSRKDARKQGHFPCSATVEELETSFTGKCHACSKVEENNGRKLGIDHDHDTGEFRGWLCHVCNIKDVLAIA